MDITKRKQAEEQIAQLNADLQVEPSFVLSGST